MDIAKETSLKNLYSSLYPLIILPLNVSSQFTHY